MSQANQAGKGDKPRPVDHYKYRANFDKIDWAKGRAKVNKKRKTIRPC